jgi:hypothetical protein
MNMVGKSILSELQPYFPFHNFQARHITRRWKMGSEWILKIGLGVWIGFDWLRIGAGGGLLWVRLWTFGFLRHGVRYFSHITLPPLRARSGHSVASAQNVLVWGFLSVVICISTTQHRCKPSTLWNDKHETQKTRHESVWFSTRRQFSCFINIYPCNLLKFPMDIVIHLFVVYLMTLFQYLRLHSVEWNGNKWTGKTWKKAIVVWF